MHDTVSAAASVGASALQRCPPDTRTLTQGRQSGSLLFGFAETEGVAPHGVGRRHEVTEGTAAVSGCRVKRD